MIVVNKTYKKYVTENNRYVFCHIRIISAQVKIQIQRIEKTYI